MRIVIIGGGLAAATAAAELRGRGFDGDVVVFAAEQHLPYERPPLSKGILQGKEEFAAAIVHDAAWYDTHHVDLRVGVSATAIDPSNRTVTDSGDATTTYDRLLLAPGAEPRRFAPAEQVGVPTYLRTIEDSERLRGQLRPGQQVVIVGGGWIGLEVAAAARIAGANVTVFEAGELPLIRVLGPEIAQVFADLHRHHGVDLRLNSQVSEADLTHADVVVVGIGAIPRTALADAAGLAVDNGILVDETLRTSDPHIYAIGDVANHLHPVLGRRIRVEHWDTAIQQGKIVAGNLLGGSEQYTRQPYFFTDQYDLGMEYFGNVGPDGYDRVDVEGTVDVAANTAFRAFWVKAGVVVAAMHANDWDAAKTVRASVGTNR
ncbi:MULTISPECIES: NAD(P)/FAD-dependent oxidoreductase [unclassified Microbacterium]|uniref:NAD(P)/FAD-dependent oxidoreductase n=1 Tax=unclassified Microbacterium TaxID=2609290 RepID=UPI00300FF593